MMFLGRLILSAMVVISLKAFSMARSELLMVLRFWYLEFPNSSKLAAPVPWKIIGRMFKNTIVWLNKWKFGKAHYFADHGGEVSSVEERVLSIANTRRVFSCLLIGERSPLWPYINYTVTWERKEIDLFVSNEELCHGSFLRITIWNRWKFRGHHTYYKATLWADHVPCPVVLHQQGIRVIGALHLRKRGIATVTEKQFTGNTREHVMFVD